MEKIIDGFRWEIVPYNKAHECNETLYILYSDGSEAEAECDADIKRARNFGLLLGIERGFVNE